MGGILGSDFWKDCMSQDDNYYMMQHPMLSKNILRPIQYTVQIYHEWKEQAFANDCYSFTTHLGVPKNPTAPEQPHTSHHEMRTLFFEWTKKTEELTPDKFECNLERLWFKTATVFQPTV